MDASLRRLTGPLLGLGFGLGLMVGAGIWLAWGGGGSALVESDQTFGQVTLGTLRSDGDFLLDVKRSATTDNVVAALQAAGMGAQAKELQSLAKGPLTSGVYVISRSDTAAELNQRFMGK